MSKDAEKVSISCDSLIKTLKELARAYPSIMPEDAHLAVTGPSAYPTGLATSPTSSRKHKSVVQDAVSRGVRSSSVSSDTSASDLKATQRISDDKPAFRESDDVRHGNQGAVHSEAAFNKQDDFTDTIEPSHPDRSFTPEPEHDGQSTSSLPESHAVAIAQSQQSPTRTPGEETFFSSAPHKFTQIMLTGGSGIPTQQFLDACTSILPLIERLGSTTFAPVRSDISGNITKLIGHYHKDKKERSTLQAMVLTEVRA